MNFSANVAVSRVLDDADPAKVKYFHADIRVKCADCGKPFEWVGLEKCGLSAYEPMVDVTAQELRAPLTPKGLRVLPGIPGFELRAN